MNTLNWRFYWDTAKFAFFLIGGGTAGYLVAKGANSAASEVATVAKMKAATKLMGNTDVPAASVDSMNVIIDQ